MSQTGPPADAKQAQAAALQELEVAQKRKRAIDTSLAALESSIYAFENSYLEESAASGGNIIKGFDNYLKPPAAINKKKLEVTNEDRLFSTSSGSFAQSIHLKAQLDQESAALARHAAARLSQSTGPFSITSLCRPDPAAGGNIDPSLLRGGGRPPIAAPPTPLPSLRKTSTSRSGSTTTDHAAGRVATLTAYAASLTAATPLSLTNGSSVFPAGLCPDHTGVSLPVANESAIAMYGSGTLRSPSTPPKSATNANNELESELQAMLDEANVDLARGRLSPGNDQQTAGARGQAKRSQASHAGKGARGARGGARGGGDGRPRKIKRSRSYTSSASARE